MAEQAHTPEAVVTDEDLAKSIELLESLLDSDGTEDMEKAVIGSTGGLQAETPSDGNINPEGIDEEHEDVADPLIAAAEEHPGTDPSDVGHPGEQSMHKALDAEEDEETSFAKSLSAAFAGSEEIVDVARGSEFAKALVMASIEGLSVANTEMQKSLSSLEQRQSARIATLEKSLTAVTKALHEVLTEVKGVANTPVRPVAKSARTLEKSFGGQAPVNTLSKAQVAEALERRVLAGKVPQLTLAKFEATGEVDPALLAEITNGPAL